MKSQYSPLFYFRPFCPCCQQANLRLGRFLCLKLSPFKHDFVWVNSRWGETVLFSKEGHKYHGAKITLYTVNGKVSIQNNGALKRPRIIFIIHCPLGLST